MSENFLASMAASSRERVQQARALAPEREVRAKAADTARAPQLALTGKFDLIAEVKLRSPAAGPLADAGEDIAARVAGYARAGAAAISVLTEPTRFAGSLTHLAQAARTSSGIPVMRKDFLVDAYQVHEARAHGAGGVLLILRMLDRAQLQSLIDAAAQHQMFCLLEAFDEVDLQLAAELLGEFASQTRLLVGLNCRDLQTLKVVPGRLEALAPHMSSQAPRVAESGVANAADAAQLVRSGFDMALVGSALMQAGDPLALAASMLAAGRAAAC